MTITSLVAIPAKVTREASPAQPSLVGREELPAASATQASTPSWQAAINDSPRWIT